ncbi:MAG: transposase [Candidatus Yanofskybacteria bacterium]|nr:transposase [Candidatus Yanofskybacteria bacterium]
MELFHTLNRGVDKRTIFLDDQDKFRFIHDLYEFNDQDRVNTTSRFFSQMNDIASRTVGKKKRKLLVDIHCFCLMGNHYHLLLSPRVENGVSRFMKKLNMGYAKYFNQKYKRTGALFEGRYKSVPVVEESHFIHIPYYIHLNPLDFMSPEWRNRTIKNTKSTIDFLENYRWSSFLDYIGIKNFPSVTSRSFLSKFFGGPHNYKKETLEWIKGTNLDNMSDMLLE